jgi:hypothetical protein
MLLDLPQTASLSERQVVQQTYLDIVTSGLLRLDMTLKALSSPAAEDKISLRAMLDALDPEISQSAPGALDKEVDRIFNLRKGPTNSSTIHAFAPVTSMLGSNAAASLPQRSPSQRFDSAEADPSPRNAHRRNKPDLKADLSKFGASLMKSKTGFFSTNK